MATDYVTSPNTPRGQVVFGLVIGLLTALIRVFGGYPGGHLLRDPAGQRAGARAQPVVPAAAARGGREPRHEPRRDVPHHAVDGGGVRARRGRAGRPCTWSPIATSAPPRSPRSGAPSPSFSPSIRTRAAHGDPRVLAPARREVVYRVGESDATRDLVFTLGRHADRRFRAGRGRSSSPSSACSWRARAGRLRRLRGRVHDPRLQEPHPLHGGHRTRLHRSPACACWSTRRIRGSARRWRPRVPRSVHRSGTQAGLDVTRDPMPEDWRVALAELRRMPPTQPGGSGTPIGSGRERLRPVRRDRGDHLEPRAHRGRARGARPLPPALDADRAPPGRRLVSLVQIENPGEARARATCCSTASSPRIRCSAWRSRCARRWRSPRP